MHKEIIKDIGEKELIRRIAEYMPPNQASDDCAFVEKKRKDLLIKKLLPSKKDIFARIC